MKKLITLVCFLLIFVANSAKAQWYAVPDIYFQNKLIALGYGSCMNAAHDSINASCGLVSSATSLNVQIGQITNLDGVQAFANIQTLICKQNPIKVIPILPANITHFDCSHANLKRLPSLPNNLTYFNCTVNLLDSLPLLPTSLTYLDCSVNKLILLPTLPANLTTIDCSNNYLTSLPVLPSSLTYLNCYANELYLLPTLPANLTTIECSNNDLTSLPVLPSSLTYLNCYANELYLLPTLPANLTTINCSNNHLTSLPVLPSNLSYLTCGSNHIKSLPTLPTNLSYINCSYNSLKNLPALPINLMHLDCSYDSITALPILPANLTYLDCSNDSITTLPILPANLTYLDCKYNQMNCLPQLPQTLQILYFDAFNKISCLPNLIPLTLNGNFWGGTLPICSTGNLKACNVCMSASTSTINLTSCGSYFFNNHQLFNNGTYYDTLTNYKGCDSIITLNLTLKMSSKLINQSACVSYLFNNQICTSSGIYYDTLVNYKGCDSLVILNLHINNSATIISKNVCSSFLFNNQTLTISGVYYDTLVNYHGCDSLITLNLTVGKVLSSINKNICTSYSFNNKIINSSGVYYDTLLSYSGCDSIITLNLTILNCSALAIDAGPDLIINPVNTPGGLFISDLTPFLACYNVSDSINTFIELKYKALSNHVDSIINGTSWPYVQNGWVGFSVMDYHSGLSIGLFAPRIGDTIMLYVKLYDTLGRTAYDTVLMKIGLNGFKIHMNNDTVITAINRPVSITPFKNDIHVEHQYYNSFGGFLGQNFPLPQPKHGYLIAPYVANYSFDFMYYPDPGFSGIDSFYYIAQDDTVFNYPRFTTSQFNRYTDTAWVYITVSPTATRLSGPRNVTVCGGQPINLGVVDSGLINSTVYHTDYFHFNFTYDSWNRDSITPTFYSWSIFKSSFLILDTNYYLYDNFVNNFTATTTKLYILQHSIDTIYLTNPPNNFLLQSSKSYYDTVFVTMLPRSVTTLNQTACDSFVFNNQTLKSSGFYQHYLSSYIGCDSIINLNLIIGRSDTTLNKATCSSFVFNNQTLTTSGVYYDTLVNYHGCDSLITLNLTVGKVLSSVNIQVCTSYSFNNKIINSSGVYYDTLVSFYGCDSIITLNFTVLPKSSSSQNQSICSGNSFTFNSQSLTVSGVYKDTLINYVGCDSVITLNLTVNNCGSWYAVPDTNFQNKIIALGYGSCMNAAHDSINGGCGLVSGATNLVVSNSSIHDLHGVEAFANLYSLDCSFDSLITLPTLPANLQFFDCRNNQLTVLPSLPLTLKTLDCNNNQLTVLPSLPPTLYTLNCYFNQISLLPSLPSNLGELDASHNSLNSLPTLPLGLIDLLIANNNFTTIPAISQLTQLNQLNVSNNNIGSIPTLPNSLTILWSGHTNINAVPAFNTNLNVLKLKGNLNLFCLPALQLVTILEIDSTPISCIPFYNVLDANQGSGWQLLPTCNISNVNACTTYANQLHYNKLHVDYVTTQMNKPVAIDFLKNDTLLFNSQALSADGLVLDLLAWRGPSRTINPYNMGANLDTSLLPHMYFVYYPPKGFTGVDTFEYIVLDSILYNNLYSNAPFYMKRYDTSMIIINVNSTPYNPAGHDTIICTAGSSIIIGDKICRTFNDSLIRSGSLTWPYEWWQDTVALGYVGTGNNQFVPNYVNQNCSDAILVSPSITTKYIYKYSGNIPYNGYLLDTIIVSVNSSIANITKVVCSTYSFNNQILTTSGVYYDTLVSYRGCDSLITLNLTVLPKSSSSQNQSICSGTSFTFNSQSLTTSGVYKDTLINYVGCDSVITLNLTVLPKTSSSQNQSICSGTSFTFNSQSLTTSGVYKDTLINYVGCDSVITLNLIILPKTSSSQNQSICSGTSFTFNSQSLTVSGIYKDTLINYVGCDSIITLNLTVLPKTSSSQNQSICSGTSFTFNSQSLTTSGIYKDTLINYVGCDSVITLNLTVNPKPTVAFTANYNSCFTATSCIACTYTGSTVSTYSWSFGTGSTPASSAIQNPTSCYASSGTHTISLTVTDANSCTNTFTDSVKIATDCVWPGDANSDLVANQYDIFAIGISYGAIGPVRNNASVVWVDQPANAWTGVLPSGKNYKHADCNGDGIINASDTLAIHNNFGLTHLREGSNPKYDKALPTLKVVFNPDTLYNGLVLTAEVQLGTVAIQAQHLYGLGFTYTYDLLVTDSNSVSWNIPTSFLFQNASDHISVGKNFKTQGQLRLAAVRNDHQTKSGYGTVINITADITSGNIPGRFNSLKNYIYSAVISGVQLIDSTGTIIPYNIEMDTSILLYQPKGIDELVLEKLIKIYPNPAQESVKIKMPFEGKKQIIIVNGVGQVIEQIESNEMLQTIATKAYYNGLYFVKIITDKGIINKQFVIQQ